MGTTPTYALPYPEGADPPRGDQQMRALAEAVDIALGDAVDLTGTGVRLWHWATLGSFTFVAGSCDVSWTDEATCPPGWRWSGTPMPMFFPRSNARPALFYSVAVGNTARLGCTVHLRGHDGSAPAGSMAVAFALVGMIEPTP